MNTCFQFCYFFLVTATTTSSPATAASSSPAAVSFKDGKSEASTPSSRLKSETRKRKSANEVRKEESSCNKDVSSLEKLEKRLSEDGGLSEIGKPAGVGNSSVESPSKAEDKWNKRNAHNSINTLEEEMKQRRAERDSPQKSSRRLDKLLEKREHQDKMKSKEMKAKVNNFASFI